MAANREPEAKQMALDEEDTLVGWALVNKVTAIVTGGAGEVTLRVGGAAGPVVFAHSNPAALLLQAERTGDLLSFSTPQWMYDLYVEKSTNATVMVHLV